jgi:hypothetical protein
VLYVAGIFGCSLLYNDLNVTSSLAPGKQMRLCNDQWRSFQAFDRVAVVKGSKLASTSKVGLEESQAMGLLQLVMMVDNSITVDQAINMGLPRCSNQYTITSTKKKFGWFVGCRSTGNTLSIVTSVRLLFGDETSQWFFPASHGPGLPSSIEEGIASLPALDDELVAALRSLPDLTTLVLHVGGGSLLPQLGSLYKLKQLSIESYCLRGQVPKNLVANMSRLALLSVTPFKLAVRATDPSGGLCGLSGALPSLNLQGSLVGDWAESLSTFNSALDMSNNQLTGQLPAHLLAFAHNIHLGNNRFSGTIPGMAEGLNGRVVEINLCNNELKVGQPIWV